MKLFLALSILFSATVSLAQSPKDQTIVCRSQEDSSAFELKIFLNFYEEEDFYGFDEAAINGSTWPLTKTKVDGASEVITFVVGANDQNTLSFRLYGNYKGIYFPKDEETELIHSFFTEVEGRINGAYFNESLKCVDGSEPE